MESDDSSRDADVGYSDEYDDYYDDDDDDVRIYVSRHAVRQQDEMNVELDTKKQPVEMGVVRSLLHQAADMISSTFPYEAVELWAQRIGKGMTDEVQLALMKASFPVDKDLIRHYAYLSRKTDNYDPFSDLRPGRGQTAYQTEQMVVKDPLQIGFTLTGKVVNNHNYRNSKQTETMVAVTVDRRRITSTLCSAHPDSSWCRHVVKLVFYRIDYPHKVQYRLPVSDSVQRLSESQVKQFVSLLISRRPLDMLPLAQEMLDDLLERKQGSRKIGIGSVPVLEVPDLTAGGGMDDDGLWRVEENEMRRIVRDYCQSNARLYRCVKMDKYGYGEASASSWLSALQRLSHENKGTTSTDTRQVFSFVRGPTHFDLASRRELMEILAVISALIEKGEQSATAALCTVTELWLEFLTNEAQTEDKGGQASNVVDSSDEHTGPRMQKLANQCVYPKNTDLMCKNSTWFLPDYITLCWRKVVFGSDLGSDDLKSIESALTTWGNQLKEVVSAGLRKTEQYDELHSSSHHRRRRFQRPDASLWRSLSGWNGFKHAAALLDPTVRFAYNLLTSTTVTSAATPVLTESFRRAETLNTVAYFVVCLRDKGMEEAAKRLARQCITAVLSLSLAEPSSAKPHVEEETTVPNSTDGLSVVAECHEKIASSLWGDQSRKGVGMALVVLFQAIEEEDWAWSTKHTYNLKPWLIPLAGETFLHGLRQNSDEQANLVVSPAMFLAVLCILTCPHAASTSTLEQVELGSEKNRILSVMFEKMDEHDCIDLQQQITKLSPVLKQKMSFLDCSAAALLILQTALSYEPEDSDYVQAVLPTVVAALHHQTKTQVDVITGLCPADFYCYQTQCAASSLEALHVYGGQEKEADIIIHSLTDTLLEILHTQGKMVKSDEWSKIMTADDSSKVKQQAHKLDNRKLVDYLVDMTSILESIDVEDDSRYRPYSRQSALEERLAFMKSSAAQLCLSNSRSRKKEQQKPPSTSCLKSRLKEKDSSAKCNTALELLLILLEIESATDGRSECRDRLIQLLKNSVKKVGAVAFIRRLNKKGWDTVLTVEELSSSFLMQDTFQRSFKGSCHQKDFPAAIEAVQQMFMSCAAALPSSCCTDLYAAARDLAVTDFLVRAVLSNNCDLKKTVSHTMLFCLAHYCEGSVSLAERFQVGIEAVRRWQQHCSDNIQSRASLVASLDRSYRFSDDLKALLGLCRLVALAVFVDRQPLMSQGTAKRVCLGAVENLVLVFSEDWIDPLCAFIVLLEVSRLFDAQWETVTSIVQESHPETWDFSSLKQVLGSQQEFFQGPKSATSLRQVCDTFECVLELAKKCKARLTAFITRCKHVACTGSAEQGANSGDEELPSRELCLRDFISLEHMCQAFPEDGFDFESLLQRPNKESSPTRHNYGYYRVVNKFTTFRRRRNGEPEDDQNDRRERGADLHFLALQHMQQVRQASSGFSFFFGNDDPDDYY